MKKIMLQLAMDGATNRNIEDTLTLIRNIADRVDILEVGTSYILCYGMDAIKRFKEACPGKTILADMKIMDGGYHHAAMGCQAGADIVTVLGVSDVTTIKNALRAAHENGKEVMVDLICTPDKEAVSALCETLGADYVCVHTGVDAQVDGRNPYEDLVRIKRCVKHCKIAVAGGINECTVGEICRLEPDVVIVGSAIHGNPDYVKVSDRIREQIDRISEEL